MVMDAEYLKEKAEQCTPTINHNLVPCLVSFFSFFFSFFILRYAIVVIP